MKDPPASFGEVLRRLRMAAALSQEELAERAGVSTRGISDLERGVRRGPRPETLRRLADVLALTEHDRALLVAAAATYQPEPSRLAQAPTPSQLPRVTHPLFGRDEERAALSALLSRADVQLVTLTGMGGTGKTHLALDVAQHLREVFPDGVVFVDLTTVTDPDHVMSVVASALNLDVGPGRSVMESVIAGLHSRQMLILLDNCEHVLTAVPQIGELLSACPDLTMLATSREALSLHGERQWPLLPLPLPDLERLPPLGELLLFPSVALFVARAEMSDPHFALTPETARAVATICHLMDGLPLAIELAASRVKLLSPDELATQLNQRLPLLTSGRRDAPARQQTMRDAIAWSYDLLTPPEQALFRHLSAFVGGWTLEAAVAVALLPKDHNILEVLTWLLDKSLVRVVERGEVSRYGMLETVREFALEQLAREREYVATRERHAAYFLKLASLGAAALEGGEQKRWVSVLEREYPNLREVFTTLETRGDGARYLQLATALRLLWFIHPPTEEGLRYLQRALAWETSQTETRAEALVGAGMLAYAVGNYADAERWLWEGEDLARILAEKPIQAYAMFMRGAVAEHLGDEISAEAFPRAALAIAQELDDAWLLGPILTNLSDAAYRRGDLEAAEHYALDAVTPLAESGNAYAECVNLANLSQVALAQGDTRRAAGAVSAALDIAEAISSRLNVANAIAGAAAVAAACDQHEQAVRLLGAADAVRETSGHPQFPQFRLVSQTEERLRSVLGQDRFQAGWDAGGAWSVEDAVDQSRAILAEALRLS